AQYHLRPAADLARCLIDKLAGPPADFLNAAPIGLPKNRTSPKGSFSTLGNGRLLFPGSRYPRLRPLEEETAYGVFCRPRRLDGRDASVCRDPKRRCYI